MALHLVALETSNVKRVRLVRLELGPEGLVVIGGNNAAGKSSLLDSIEWAMAGAAGIDAEPLRRGAKRGYTQLALRDAEGRGYNVERSYSEKGSRLVVTSPEGEEQRAPQAILDGLCSAIAFDPVAFAALDQDAAAEALRKLVGLDTADLDEERDRLYAERTRVNRDARELGATLERMPYHRDAPAEAISLEALLARQAEERAELARRQDHVLAVERAEAELERSGRSLVEARQECDRWLRLVAEREAEANEAAKAMSQGVAELAVATQELPPDLEATRAAIAAAGARNEMLRDNARRAEVEVQHADAVEGANRLTLRLDLLDEERRKRIEALEFPVPGLGFDPQGRIVYEAIPFAQASHSEQIRVSVAIGMAANPRLRLLLIRQGASLDETNLALVAEIAREHGYLVLMERVGDGEEVSVVIEDGEVLEDRRNA